MFPIMQILLIILIEVCLLLKAYSPVSMSMVTIDNKFDKIFKKVKDVKEEI